MTVTVTLTFDQLTSKSIGIIYILTHMSVPNLTSLVNSVFNYLHDVWSIYVDGYCDLDLRQITLKMKRAHLNSMTNVCVKFDETMSIPCILIIWTRFGRHTNMSTISVTLTIGKLISKSIGIIYTPIQMSVPSLRNLGQLCVQLSSGQVLVYISICWQSLWPWPLTNWPQNK